MYDKPKVLAGMFLFLVLATLPFWISTGKSKTLPPPVATEGSQECVEDPAWMRANHMQLLNDWRHSVVRDGERTYVNSAGKKFDKSLTGTCLDCHSNKNNASKALASATKSGMATVSNQDFPHATGAQFCDQCHNQVAVKPFCFSCHLVPPE